MTAVSTILVGNFACAAIFVAYYLSLTIFAQFRSGPITWVDSKPMRLAAAMALFVSGCALFIVAAFLAPTISVMSGATYMVWGGWFLLWVAEITALTSLGRVSPALCTCAMWTIYTLVARGMV